MLHSVKIKHVRKKKESVAKIGEENFKKKRVSEAVLPERSKGDEEEVSFRRGGQFSGKTGENG